MSGKESQEESLQDTKSHKSLQKQLLCAFVINLVSLLQGASVSTSSIILHNLQNHGSDKDAFSDISISYNSSDTNSSSAKYILFEDFSVTAESGSWIGRKISYSNLSYAIFFIKLAVGFLDISSLPVLPVF